jgi:hypothetical protein
MNFYCYVAKLSRDSEYPQIMIFIIIDACRHSLLQESSSTLIDSCGSKLFALSCRMT